MNRWLITLLVASGTCVGAEIPARLSVSDREGLQTESVLVMPITLCSVVLPAMPVIAVAPVTVTSILSVLLAPDPDPVVLKATVGGASIDVLADVFVSVADSPKKLSALIEATNPKAILSVAALLAQNAKEVSPAVQQASLDALASIILHATVASARIGESLPVIAEIVRTNPRLEVTVFVLDPARWITVRELTETSHIYEGNWIGTAVERLRTRIAREGYSDDVMSEFQQIKERLSQPVTQSPRGGDATGYR